MPRKNRRSSRVPSKTPVTHMIRTQREDTCKAGDSSDSSVQVKPSPATPLDHLCRKAIQKYINSINHGRQKNICDVKVDKVRKAKPDENWQCEPGTVEDLYLLDNELYTDCSFKVGPAGEIIKCHMTYLAKTSSVFEKMFFIDKSNPIMDIMDPIPLPEIGVQPFRAMMRYIYSGRIELSNLSYQMVCELLSLTKQYRLCVDLQEEIRDHLYKNLVEPTNVWIAINFATQANESRLLEMAWQVVQLNAEKVVQYEDFLTISSSTLEQMLQKEYLKNTSEMDLFNNCKRWAENELTVNKQPITSDNMREKMLPFLPHIRFMKMSFKDFCLGPLDVLTPEELVAVLKAKGHENAELLPKNFSHINKGRNECNITE